MTFLGLIYIGICILAVGSSITDAIKNNNKRHD